jgi:tetratricopeptide (TPR) repeat protein
MTPTSSQQEFIDLSMTLYKIGVVLKQVGQFDKSFRCLEQSLSVQQAKGGGRPSELTAKTLNNMGVVASNTGNYAAAARFWHQAIDEYKRAIPTCREGDRIVQAIRGNIAMAERLCIH